LENKIPLKEETEPLDSLKDGHKKWRCLGADCPDSCCGFRFREALIFINEIPHLSQYFPLSFNVLNQPDGKTDISLSIFLRAPLDISPCVYLSDGEGCTLGENRPLTCKQRPFCMIKDLEGQYKVALRPSCPGFSRESGQNILMPDGTINSLIYRDCVRPAISAAEMAQETQSLVETLQKHDLISVGCCEHRGQKVFMHIIDAQKVLALPREVRDSFQEKGYTDLILAHIKSIVHLRRFIDIYLDTKR